MITQQLIEYIENKLKEGVDKDTIRKILLENGWQNADIDEAFSLLEGSLQDSRIYPSSSLSNLNSSQPLNHFNKETFTPQQSISNVATSTATPQTTFTLSKTNKKLLFVIIPVVISLVLAGAILAYFLFQQTSPEKVFAKMVEEMKKVKSVEYEGEVRFTNKNTAQPTSNSTSFINFNGIVDLNTPDSPKQSSTIDFKIPIESDNLNITLDYRQINNTLYLKFIFDIESIKNSRQEAELVVPLLNNISNKWIKIDPQQLQEELQREGAIIPYGKDLKPEISEEQKMEIKNLISQWTFVQITDKLPSEKIEGFRTKHYKFTISKEKLIDLMIEIKDIIAEKQNINNSSKSGLEEILLYLPSSETRKKLEEALNDIEIEGELWIGKKDYLLYKLSGQIKTINQDKFVNMVVNLKNFNKKFKIESPTQAKTLQEIIQGFLQPTIETFPSTLRETHPPIR